MPSFLHHGLFSPSIFHPGIMNQPLMLFEWRIRLGAYCKKKRVVRGSDAARNSALLMLRIMPMSAATRNSEDPLLVHPCG
ncbi:unnamed protein product [Urochloa humidicola]